MNELKEMVNDMTLNDDELDRLLEEKLNLIKPTPPRNPEVALQRRDDYRRKVRYLQFGKPVFALAGLLNNKPWQSLFSQRPSLLPFAAAILLIFGLVFGGVGTVYAAQDSLPNDLLYSVKLSAENLRLAFTQDTDAKISLLTTYTGRRVQEAISLTMQGQPIPEDLPSRVDAQLDELFALTDSLDEESSQEALKGIQIHLRDQDQDMTNAMTGLPEGLDPELVQLRSMMKARQHVALTGVEQPNSFQHQQQFKYKHAQPTTPLTSTITTTVPITPSVTTTPEITVTLTITSSGHYGPGGPCDVEEIDCGAPFGYMDPFGPFQGEHPVDDDLRGYGPGADVGQGPLQPSETPKPGNIEPPKESPGSSGGDDSSKDKGDSGSKNGNP